MLNNIEFSLIFFQILLLIRADKSCDIADCNYEGECVQQGKEKICSCIGDNSYFKGATCSEPINNCLQNPCQNGGKCVSITGQFICKECNTGYGGLWCDSKVPDVFTNLLLYFNHYGYYAKSHQFIIFIENLGKVSFAVEFVSDHYAIDSWETNPDSERDTAKWIYSNDLSSIITSNNIKYYNDLPYSSGYYHLSNETFWQDGLQKLTLRSYDTETASKLFYEHIFDLLVLKSSEQCIPQVKFFHGFNPVDPLMVDIARFNNFEAILKKRCFNHSEVLYRWSVYNSIGTVKLYDFGNTKQPILKVAAYKLWFNYHDEVMSSYQIRIQMVESIDGQIVETQASCFILVLPKPVKAIIKGGSHRSVGIKQELFLDGTASRDFALEPNAEQDMIYRWHCFSKDDPDNPNCQRNLSSDSKFQINSTFLKLNSNYDYSLHITSKVNKLISDETHQLVQIVENPQLHIYIECVRNCMRNEFTVDKFIHLKVEQVRNTWSETAKFQWSLRKDQSEFPISKEQRLIYYPKESDKDLNFEVIVKDEEKSGKALIEVTKNLPAQGGTCSIEPLKGQAFTTEFFIKCENYQDEDTPLNYQYIVGDFPLQRINDAKIHIKLPETDAVAIKICDQFEACIENVLTVTVSAIEKPKNLTKFISDSNLSKLLKEGDILTAMILMKSLVKYVNSKSEIWQLMKEIQSYDLMTLLEIEQFFTITKEILINMLPFDNEKAVAFLPYFQKINNGFKSTIEDNEIKELQLKSYENMSKELMKIMSVYSKTWEFIAPAQQIQAQTIQSSDPLAENYDNLPDFDTQSLKRILNWLHGTYQLQKSLDYLGLAAVDLYYPLEKPFVIQEDNINLQIYAFENFKTADILIKNESLLLTLEEATVNELKRELNSSIVLLQIASLNTNPFWWLPGTEPIDTDVIHLSAFSSKSSLKHINLNHPLQYQLKLNNPVKDPFSKNIEGVLKNKLHMPLYYMEVKEKAILIITFIKAERPLRILVQYSRNPVSYDVKTIGRQIRQDNLAKKYVYYNHLNKDAIARMAILLDDNEGENVTFAFITEVRECVTWDYDLTDPDWSTKGCKPLLKINTSMLLSLKCECHHMSSFAAKTYRGIMQEDLDEHTLLSELPTNWYMVAFYVSILITFAIILLYNFWILKNQKEYLNSNTYSDNNYIEVRIYTGSHWNSDTSANITLRLISEKGLFSVSIYQNPENPLLKRNSVCKLLLNANEVKIPAKIQLNNDQTGRFASWYCRKIELENLKTNATQLFRVNQWINQSLEIIEDSKPPLTFKEEFLENLTKSYIEWYQFNGLWGCWQYENFNRFERSCIWISQFMATLFVVGCYFKRTTMQNYEMERETYYYLYFYTTEIFVLSIVGYILSEIVKLIFMFILKKE